jgi:hypothetical protein
VCISWAKIFPFFAWTAPVTQFPALRLFGVPESGNAGVTFPVRMGRDALGDNQPGTGPLTVVQGHQVVGESARVGSAPGHGVHYEAVFQFHLADRGAFK